MLAGAGTRRGKSIGLENGWGAYRQDSRRIPAAGTPIATPVMVARQMIASRRALEGALPAWLIPDPVIDILLALYVAQADGKAMTDDDVCAATSVRPTIALRWIKALQSEGYVERLPGSISLTATGHVGIDTAMTAIMIATPATSIAG